MFPSENCLPLHRGPVSDETGSSKSSLVSPKSSNPLSSSVQVGSGGISVLHDDRIKGWFGDNRRFIRCDELPVSCAHFLSRLSEVISARVDNPKKLIPLRPFLTSREMFIVLDNAERIFGLQGTNSREIYTVVDELPRFKSISLRITSLITTVPQHCSLPD